jgi:DNA-binding SARP family transcriptional activator
LLRGELAEAASVARAAADRARAEGNMQAHHAALIIRAEAAAYLDRSSDVHDALAEAADALATMTLVPTLVADDAAVRTRIALHAGDRAAAQASLATGWRQAPQGAIVAALRREEGALALAEGRLAEASRLLGEAAAMFGDRRRRPDQALALCLRVEALWRQGKEARAAACLGEVAALDLGEPWLRGLAFTARLAEPSLRALAGRYWRVQGKTRQVAEALVAAGAGPGLRVMPRPAAPRARGRAAAPLTAAGPLTLHVSPFGEGSVTIGEADAVPLRRLGGPKTRELLAFALWKARTIGREEILDALWDSEDTPKTAGALRMASHQLRRYLGPELWSGDPSGAYRLQGPVDDTLRTLLALAVGSEDLAASPARCAELSQRGLTLYQGGYLPWCSSPWTDEPRRLVRSAALALVTSRVAALRALGQGTAALAAAVEGLVIEPTHEGLNADRIHLLAELGRTGEAVACFHAYEDLLDDEALGRPPAALRSFIARLKGASMPARA